MAFSLLICLVSCAYMVGRGRNIERQKKGRKRDWIVVHTAVVGCLFKINAHTSIYIIFKVKTTSIYIFSFAGKLKCVAFTKANDCIYQSHLTVFNFKAKQHVAIHIKWSFIKGY